MIVRIRKRRLAEEFKQISYGCARLIFCWRWAVICAADKVEHMVVKIYNLGVKPFNPSPDGSAG